MRRGRPDRLIRRAWGAGPLHLLGHLALIAVTALVLMWMFEPRFAPQPWNLVLWLLGGAILHDAVFLPAYSALNVVVARILRRDAQRAVPILNFIRVPVVLSGMLLLVFSPRIFNGQPQNFERALGHPPPDYLGRWLLVTAVIVGATVAWYLWRVLRVRRAGGPRTGDPATPDSRSAAPGVAPTQ